MAVKRNAAYNLAGLIGPLAVMFVTVPMFISRMGEDRYGTLVLVWLLTGFLFFFDFGVGQSVQYEISRRAKDEGREKEEIFWTGLVLSLVFGAAGAVVAMAGAWVIFGHFMDLSPQLNGEVMGVLGWIGVGLPITTVNGVLSGALIGREKFLLYNIRNFMGTMLEQLLPLLAIIVFEPTLTYAVPASMIGKLISLAFLLFVTFKHVPAGWKPRYRRQWMKPMLGYGIWTSVGALGRQLLVNSDRFVIGSLLGPASVALYAVPANLLQRTQLFSRAVGQAMFAKVSRADKDGFTIIAEKLTRVNLAASTCMSAAAIVAIEPFFAIWIDPDFARRSALVGQLVAFSSMYLSASVVPAMMLRATGRPKDTTTTLLMEVIPFLLIIYLGAKWYGITGVAVGLIIRGAADFLLLGWRSGILGMSLRLSLQAVGLLALTLAATLLLPGLSLLEVIAKLAVLGIIGVWSLWLSPDIRNFVVDILGKVRRLKPTRTKR